jgi:acetoacetyl-CoA synthetase
MSEPLWRPEQYTGETPQLHDFMARAREVSGQNLSGYADLHRWSVEQPEAFWRLVWDFCDLVGDGPGDEIMRAGQRFRDTRWFPETHLNFAENLLQRRDNKIAIVAVNEAGERDTISWHDLYVAAGQVAAQLLAAGIQPGDRVAGYLPNRIETIIAALGSAWVGATWSSCSPDFGVEGVMDRFGQIEPRVLFVCKGYHYNGKWIDLAERVDELHDRLKPDLMVQLPDAGPELADALDWRQWLDGAGALPDPVRLPFDHPLYILYSSGTTGKPKCIVHGAGGTLIQHAKELRLHTDVRPGDRFFYFTTCGWMMWNWLVSGLQCGATLVLYDGNPGYPGMERLFDLIDAEDITHFGTSAKFIQAVEKAGVTPRQSHQLSTLRTLLSTGSPLLHESYDFIFQQIKPDLLVSSISGGTDIISCFALGNPMLPVHRGELQCLGLGMDVAVFDEDGHSVENQRGELVCQQSFPSCPVYFWNDPEGERFHQAYFDRFDNIWAHGDFAEVVPHESHRGLIIHGRSDAVLNPGGVRIGTAEIYRQVETLPEIRESVVIGQQYRGDVRVVLFVVMQADNELDDGLRKRIRETIRQGASPRHVPAVIVAVPEIPRTVSGKIVELAVRNVVHNEPVKNRNALANPEALRWFRDLPALQE